MTEQLPTMETRKEFALRHRVSVRMVDGWIRDNTIPYYKFGRKCVRIPSMKADEALENFLIWSE